MTNIEKEWGPMVKVAGDRIIAENGYSTTWDDMAQDTYSKAKVYLKDNGHLLFILDKRTVGPYVAGGERTELVEKFDMGTLQKPNLGAVRTALAKNQGYGHNKFSKEWYRMENDRSVGRAPLSVILADIAKNSPVSGVDPKQTEGMKAAIMEKLDDLTPEQVAKIFQAVRGMR
jgi:hypothetical protein